MIPRLVGDCVRCGACCVIEQRGERYVCDHLLRNAPIGEAFATFCAIYKGRTHGMPITMTAPSGAVLHAKCAAHGTEEERLAIIAQGLGRGCSLVMA
jgi:hypothetical protein